MADVFTNVEFIRNAQFGYEVREAIADSIEQCYADATAGPNSLASIVQKIFNGKIGGIGDIIEGINSWETDIENIAPLSVTTLNSIYLKPGTWLLLYNVTFTSGAGDSASPYNVWCTISSTDTAPSYMPINYSTSLDRDPSDLGTSYSGFYVTEVTEEDATISDSDPDKDGTDLYNLYTFHSGTLAASAKSTILAIRIKANSDDETSLTEQVAQNTAAIANMQSYDSEISSIKAQHENDVDELNTLIEDSVTSLRASLDEKSLAIDENGYLTFD